MTLGYSDKMVVMEVIYWRENHVHIVWPFYGTRKKITERPPQIKPLTVKYMKLMKSSI